MTRIGPRSEVRPPPRTEKAEARSIVPQRAPATSSSFTPQTRAPVQTQRVGQLGGGVSPERAAAIRAELDRVSSPGAISDLLAGRSRVGALSAAERDYVAQEMFSRAADGNADLLQLSGEYASEYPDIARAIGQAYQSGALTDADLLAATQAFPTYAGEELGALFGASDNPSLQAAGAATMWRCAPRDDFDRDAFRRGAVLAAGTSPEAMSRLVAVAGRSFAPFVDTLLQLASVGGPNAAATRPLTNLLTAIAAMPPSTSTDAIGAMVMSRLPNTLLSTTPALKEAFFAYLGSARSDPNLRGLKPENGFAYTAAELERRFPDPAIRNYMVTEQYFRFSTEMSELIPGAANWATYATWASAEAGSAIRAENAWQSLGEGFNIKFVSAAISHGNSLVAGEIGQAFGAFIETFRNDPRASFDTFWARSGLPDESPLKGPFQSYYQTMQAGGVQSDADAERMLLANAQIGMYEQRNLQPDIQNALAANLPFASDLLSDVMTLAMPGMNLTLKDDLPGSFSGDLAELSNAELAALAAQYPGPQGTGADDWANYDQRMRYIFNLFRLTQANPALFDDWRP